MNSIWMRTTQAGVFASLIVSVAHAAPVWREGVTYTAGTVVSYQGLDYQALVTHTAYVGANWTPPNTPVLWRSDGSSTGTSPVPTPVAPATQVPTVVPPTLAPPVAGCHAAWSPATIYTAGQRVTHAGINYEAKWWTQGDDPSRAGQWGPWRAIGACVSVTATPIPTPTLIPTLVPSLLPTVTPTALPTAQPTLLPTATPTATPTAIPTPTVTPTVTPTPTAIPTVAPTIAPTATPTATPQPTQAPALDPALANGLAHYYALDGQGIDAVGNTALQSVGAVAYTTGYFGNGSQLNALQGAAHFLPRDFTGAYTLAFWVHMLDDMGTKLASVAANKDWGTGSNAGISIGRNNDGRYKFNVGDGSKRVDAYLAGPAKSWGFVALVVNPAAKTIQAYATDANGTLNTTALNYNALGNIYPTYQRWAFNEDARGDYYARYPAERFTLEYDDIAVWSRTLAASEIGQLAAGKAPVSSLNPQPLPTTVPTPLPTPSPALSPTPSPAPDQPPVGTGAPTLTIGPALQAPATDGVTVLMETAQSRPQVWVRRYGSADAFTRQNAAVYPTDATVYHARLGGLQSNTLYEYYVRTESADGATAYVSPRYAFKTWPKATDGVESAKFVVFSDTQDGRGTIFNDIVNQGVMKHDCDASQPVSCAQNVAGMLISGDMVASGNSRDQWRSQFFGRMQALSPYVPIIAAPGNHEYFGEEMGNPATVSQPNIANAMKTYRKYFAGVPDNGSASYRGFWYSTDFLGLRLIVLDSTPIAGRHTHGNWTPLSMYWDSFRVEQLGWFKQQVAGAEAAGKPFVFSIDHAPCLSEKWRNGEVIAACEFVAELEDYSHRTNAITGNLFGHVHSYGRGHSMDVKHLWLNAASASGALEGGGNQGSDGKDLGVFVITHDEFGYNTLNFTFGAQPAVAMQRRSSGGAGTDVSFPVSDSISLVSGNVGTPPQLVQTDLGSIVIAGLNLDYLAPAGVDVLEAHWQLARAPDFADAFDVWGNETRKENWFYTGTSGTSFTNTRAGKLVTRLELGNLLASRELLQDGGNEEFERWTLSKGATCWTTSGARGGQCTHRSSYDRFGDVKPAAFKAVSGETWYYRVRVRDQGLNWSPFSNAGSFTVQ
ncbi:Alpha-amylase [Andreprevotia sp. IGB-42]|uniref:carbohydrate-binding protein n=1 Tax=Andreprevotia sp. IGB-42 TaxID=2497473 RepID=UPI0013582D47|nr:carbohydrate-binding protein [Andreprevotia sp. IGB-42]KAF0813702.1 Alpha-amylase [Andreprevotia sp. IGB-42]